MVIIHEIELVNSYTVDKLRLSFDKHHYVTIFNCPISHKLKDKLLLAIQPFFLKQFYRIPFECNTGAFRRLSSVRVTFTIPKGKFKENIRVEAYRNAQKPEIVYYYFGKEQYIDNFEVYHERCRIDVTSLFPCLNRVFSNENKNLMNIWIENDSETLKLDSEHSYLLFEKYLRISHLRPESERLEIAKIRNSIITLDRHTNLLEKQTFINVGNKIGEIFKYITFGKYTVQFRIPHTDPKNKKKKELKWDEMDFLNSVTYIQNMESKTLFLWNTMEPGLKCLLKIAQKIALAKNLGHHCIIIKNTTLIQNYQNEEMIREAIIEDNETNTRANWKNKNFLNQIVNVCNEMEIMLFINYHGGLPLPPENANIIRCTDTTKFPDKEPLYVSETAEQMNLKDFVHLIKPPTPMET